MLEAAEEVADPLLVGELADLVGLAINDVSNEASNMDVQTLVFLNCSCSLHEGEQGGHVLCELSLHVGVLDSAGEGGVGLDQVIAQLS